ncbi:MAG: hypothetical protein ACFB13_07180 [Kiloniellaceae bacterium]
MNARCRALLACSALLSAALVLTGCESVGQGMAESNMRARAERYAAQGNPQFSDPQLQAVVKDFEARYAVIGSDVEKLGLEQGIPCPVSKEVAFKILKAMSVEDYGKMQADVAEKVPGYTNISDLDSIRLSSLSGVCGANGPEGPSVVVGTTRDIMRVRGDGYSMVTVTDTVTRVEGIWVDGERQGQQTLISISGSTQFKETADGQLGENIDEWDFLNEIRNSPTASYTYILPKADGAPKYIVGFGRNHTTALHTTSVTEYLDAQHAYTRIWQGTELLQENRTKDGRLHGWMIMHPTEYDGISVPGRRDCYQNGEQIKTLECPPA